MFPYFLGRLSVVLPGTFLSAGGSVSGPGKSALLSAGPGS